MKKRSLLSLYNVIDIIKCYINRFNLLTMKVHLILSLRPQSLLAVDMAKGPEKHLMM